MSSTARLTVDLPKITHNASEAVSMCRRFGIDVVGVVKGACGDAFIAQAMLDGGVQTLGDARLDNVSWLRDAGIRAPIVLIRSPAPREVEACVELADASLNADLSVIRALSAAAGRMGRTHGVMPMVDLDTGREGFAPEEVSEVCREVAGLDGLTLRGLGMYFGRGSEDHVREAGVERLVALAKKVEGLCGVALPVISAGSTNVFRSLTLAGKHVPGMTELRLGTAILLGLSTSIGPQRIEGFHQDTFVLEADLIEVKQRDRLLGILPFGRLDAEPDFLFPTAPGVTVLRATNDHTIVDLSAMPEPPRVGESVEFELGYSALCRLVASPYVSVEYGS